MSRADVTLVYILRSKPTYENGLKIITLFLLSLFLNMESYSQSQNYLIPKIDHVLIAVNNLDSAKIEYEKYGFTVVYGGKEKKAFNALIFLRDGSVIELIGKDRLPSLYTFLNKLRIIKLFGIMKDRITAFRNLPAGLFNYCLYTENLDSTYEYLKQNGLKVSKPVSFSRHREDEIKIRWELVGMFPYDLPFFIENYNPSRLSDTANTSHKNNAIAIDTLIIETNAFNKYVKIYNVIYNQTPQVSLNNSVRTSTYKLTEQYVILKEASIVHSFFSKKDLSAPVKISVKCDQRSEMKPEKVNEFITLTN